MNLKADKKQLLPCLVCVAVLAVAFCASFAALHGNTVRRVFIFPSVEKGRMIVETRFLPKDPVQGAIALYVDELLLGPQTERTRMLFAPGTRAQSCFVRKNVLYLDLSDDVLSPGNGVVEMKEGARLLEQNVRKNFREITRIELFVDGKYASENH